MSKEGDTNNDIGFVKVRVSLVGVSILKYVYLTPLQHFISNDLLPDVLDLTTNFSCSGFTGSVPMEF